jgi:hypothetical protein
VTDTLVKMDPADKAEWVRRLRSGEYDQGKSYLADGEIIWTDGDTVDLTATSATWCCLGVYCAQRAPEKAADWWDEETSEISEWVDDPALDEAAADIMPDLFALWKVKTPHAWDRAPVSDFLAAMNDGGATFLEIADVIEEYL